MPGEKDAIALARKTMNEQSGKGGGKDTKGSKGGLRYDFVENKQDATIEYQIPKNEFKQNTQAMTEKDLGAGNSFGENKEDVNGTPDKRDKAKDLTENKKDVTAKGAEPIDPRRLAFREEMKKLNAKKQKNKGRGKDLDL